MQQTGIDGRWGGGRLEGHDGRVGWRGAIKGATTACTDYLFPGSATSHVLQG